VGPTAVRRSLSARLKQAPRPRPLLSELNGGFNGLVQLLDAAAAFGAAGFYRTTSPRRHKQPVAP
jgi:hypothetical protein